MARGNFNKERWIQFYLDRWLALLQMNAWRITWDIFPVVYDDKGEEVIVHSEYTYKLRRGYLKFNRRKLRTKVQIERAVSHDLSHMKLGKGTRQRDEDMILNRLDLVLIQLRRRLSYVYA